METKELILAVMSISEGASYSPVKIQKLFFLIDVNLGKKIGGPHFNFQPYHYGPFDRGLYEIINELRDENLIDINEASLNAPRSFRLTVKGQKLGEKLRLKFKAKQLDYIKRLDTFVRSSSFKSLVSSIYKAYPEMRVNSIFE